MVAVAPEMIGPKAINVTQKYAHLDPHTLQAANGGSLL